MLKRDYFIAACKTECFTRKAWVISCFALTAESPDDWQKEPYPYRLVQTRTGYFFVEPGQMNLVPIEDAPSVAEPLCTVTDQLLVKAGDIPNLAINDVVTTYGNLLWNWIMLAHPLSGKIPFINDRVSPGQLEGMILKRLVDDPAPGEPKVVPRTTALQPIYVSEYLKVVESAFYLTGFTQLWVPADTEKTLTPPPGLKEFKAKLLEENKGKLDDPAVVAAIDKQLIEFDSRYLAGDEAEGFLITDKSRSTVRRKLFLSMGAEQGLSETVKVDMIPNSLTEGWDITKFPTMNNVQRAGSFNRSAQTMLGGESVKWLLRASSNTRVSEADCGTRLGVPTTLTAENIKKYLGFSVVIDAGHEVLTEETSGKYLGREMMVRSPMFCVLEKTDYCTVCVGPRLALNPTALSSAITDIGSTIMLIFMKAAHAKNLAVEKMNYLEELQ